MNTYLTFLCSPKGHLHTKVYKCTLITTRPGLCRLRCSILISQMFISKTVKYCAFWLELHILGAGLQHYHSTENKEWELGVEYLLVKEVFQATKYLPLAAWQNKYWFFLNYIVFFSVSLKEQSHRDKAIEMLRRIIRHTVVYHQVTNVRSTLRFV